MKRRSAAGCSVCQARRWTLCRLQVWFWPRSWKSSETEKAYEDTIMWTRRDAAKVAVPSADLCASSVSRKYCCGVTSGLESRPGHEEREWPRLRPHPPSGSAELATSIRLIITLYTTDTHPTDTQGFPIATKPPTGPFLKRRSHICELRQLWVKQWGL